MLSGQGYVALGGDPGPPSRWSRLVFSWASSLVGHGLQQAELCDLPALPPGDSVSGASQAFQAAHTDGSLIRTFFRAFGAHYLFLGLLKLVVDLLGFAGPLLLNEIVVSIQSPEPSGRGLHLSLALCGTLLCASVLRAHYDWAVFRVSMRLRSALVMQLYRKALGTRPGPEVHNLVTSDTQRVMDVCCGLHQLWSLPLQIGVALVLLARYVGPALLGGLAVVLGVMGASALITRRIGAATRALLTAKDRRVRATAELLAGMRQLKLLGLVGALRTRVRAARAEELQHLGTLKYLDALCVYFWATTPVLMSMATFGVYLRLSGSEDLDAARIFTTLALLGVLVAPLNAFPWVVNGMVEARVSIDRVGRFLHAPDTYSCVPASADLGALDLLDATLVVGGALVLSRATLRVRPGDLVVVSGAVATGKTSVLLALLGELPLRAGAVARGGSAAYVAQDPWIENSSIRANILFGQPYDAERYLAVVDAVALTPDLAELPGGDAAAAGERGATLSGGQRLRLALARAVYSDAPILLLDDPLSAVDDAVARVLLHQCIEGPLCRSRTVVLVTHRTDLLHGMNYRHIILGSGALTEGSSSPTNPSPPRPRVTPPPSSQPVLAPARPLVALETRQQGTIEWRCLSTYLSYIGGVTLALVLLSLVLMQGTRNLTDVSLAHWAAGTRSPRQLLVYLGVLGAANSFFTLTRAFSFAYAGLRAARGLFAEVLGAVTHTRLVFFERNPLGRVLNRFTSDTSTVDSSVPFISNILLAQLLGLLGTLSVLLYANPWFAALLLPLSCIYRVLLARYRSLSRQFRRLDAVTRSPIHSNFTQAVDGGVTLRAYSAQARFLDEQEDSLTDSQQVLYLSTGFGKWLDLRLELVSVSVVAFVALSATVSSRGASPELVGLALTYALPILGALNAVISAFTETEKELVSVERVVEYLDLPPEPQGTHPAKGPGRIEFRDVSLRYRPDLPLALDGVSFIVEPGQHWGIVGRTGSGKSSLLEALLGLRDGVQGAVLLDGVPVEEVLGLQTAICVIPQHPLVFTGSLRDNLDPLGQHPDDRVLDACQRCGVRVDQGLDQHLEAEASGRSRGETQLLALARALLSGARVLCLDEATSALDPATDALVQRVLRQEFAQTTLLVIAHRVDTLAHSTRVLTMSRGRIESIH